MSEAYKAKQIIRKAIELLDQLLVKYPDNVMAYTYRGYAHMMTENYDLALSDYKKRIAFILR